MIDTVFRDLDRLCQDLGLTHRALARRARLDPGFVGHLFERRRDPSGATLVALCEAVGSDLSIRLFPRPGTPIFDRSQALIVEALIALSAGTATAFPEVHTRRPARGFIDLVLDRTRSDLIACEVQSRIDRLEQHLRWLTEKAESLPSSEIWAQLGGREGHQSPARPALDGRDPGLGCALRIDLVPRISSDLRGDPRRPVRSIHSLAGGGHPVG